MMLPPVWKVRREVQRIQKQLDINVGEVALRAAHDAFFRSRVSVAHGTLPQLGKLAISVIYQPWGIARSTLLTLRHLADHGYAAVAVCNGPHPAESLAQLGKVATAVIVRPNFGYDFGAYRDGLKLCGPDLAAFDRIVVVNDSTWFPLRRDDDTLARMEVSGLDVTGHILKAEVNNRSAHDHVESHLLMFSAGAIASDAFQRFWRGYPMSSDRSRTIQRGEMRLSNALHRSGLVVGGLIDRDSMGTLFSAQARDVQRELIEKIVHHRPEAKKRCAALLARWDRDPMAPGEFRAWMFAELANSRLHVLSANFIEMAMRLGKMGFVKKSREPRFHMARQRVLEAEAAGRIPPLDPIVRTEIAQDVERWTPPVEPFRPIAPTMARA